MAVLAYCSKPAGFECLTALAFEQHRAVAAGEMPDARPVGKAQRQLQAAAPVRPLQVGALLEPRVDEHPAAFCEAPLTAETPGLGESHRLEMAVRLPQVLDVANHRGVPVVQGLPEAERRIGAARGIPVPRRRKAECPLPAEEIETAREDLLRRLAVSSGREVRGPLRDPGPAACGIAGQSADARKARTLQLRAQLLRAAIAELARAHRTHTLQGPAEVHLPICNPRTTRR